MNNIRPVRSHLSSASLSLMGIPKKFHNMTLDDFVTDSLGLENVKSFINQYMCNLYSNFYKGAGIFLYGANGTGKTMLSSLILKEAYRLRFDCRRITFSDYISLYTSVWGSKGDNKEEAEDNLNRYKSIDFLVLEEIGKEVDSSVSVPILEDLLRYREDKSLVTIICTNLSPNLLKEEYGASIFSLIKGNMTPVEMDFKDQRHNVFKRRKENKGL